MQEIGDFLEKLGMPEYGECFAQNKIDLSVLPNLTDQDLKDIGVPLGHRRKMLAAIRGLPGESPVASKTVPTGEAKAQDTAERRQLVSVDDEGHRHQTVARGLVTDARYGAVQLDVVSMGVPQLR